MRGTGIRLAQAGYAVFGLDVEGHGKSDGLQAYIPSFNNIVDDTISYFKSVRGLFIHLLNPYLPPPQPPPKCLWELWELWELSCDG
jgi:alpha-beta hydrolase superfamily lysophospholipase